MAGNDGLEAKFKLLSSLPYERRAKRKHILVFGFILDWYHSTYGDALASVRHISDKLKERDPSGKGLFIGDIHSALKDLLEWGFLRKEDGSGRRANRYTPNWSLVRSVRESPNATGVEVCVRESPNTSVRESPNTNADSVRESTNKDILTGPGHRSGDLYSNVTEADAPAAIAPGAASGFERIWLAYGRYGNKAAARKVFAAIHNPNVDLIAERASSWAASAKPGQGRMPLEKWLAAEKYDEADRRTTRGSPSADNDNEVDDVKVTQVIPDPRRRVGRWTGTITSARVEQTGGDTAILIELDGGKTRRVISEAADDRAQERGQRELAHLSGIAGADIEDAAQLHGLAVSLVEFDDGDGEWKAA